MRFLTKTISIIALFIIGISIAWFVGFKYSFVQKNISEDLDVVMNKVEKVSKWVTVEAYFSEIYDYKDYYYYDFSPLRKKALIRVKAKVSAGYDFSAFSMVTNDALKTITINNFPPPEILSVDHELDYYDISEGTFNSFTPEEYNELQKNAKDYITKKAAESNILKQAEDHKEELIEILKFTIEAAGWKLIVEPSKVLL